MTTALDQLRYIDEQLAGAALPQDQAELVRVHRLTGLQLRTQRMQGKQLDKESSCMQRSHFLSPGSLTSSAWPC